MTNKIDLEKLKEACLTSKSMLEASRKTGLPLNTFKRYALKENLYSPNQSGKGLEKGKIKIDDVLQNKVYSSRGFVKAKLFQHRYKEKRCEQCKLTEWLSKEIPLELHHIDGNGKNNALENLQMLCPNCHAQTDNYRKKKQ